jgi:hypothetical protein
MSIGLIPLLKDLGAFPALRAGKRAFRCKSSDLLMQILWAFRCNQPFQGCFRYVWIVVGAIAPPESLARAQRQP